MQVNYRDDGVVGKFYQSTLTYGDDEIVSRVEIRLVACARDPVQFRLDEDLRALKNAGVPPRVPVVSTATCGLIALSK